MRVAIIITAYNRPQYLAQCLESLRTSDLQIPGVHLEITIIDDASTDPDTLSVYNNHGIMAVPVTVIRNPTNLGIAATLHKAFADKFTNKTDIVMNLDGDSIVRRDFLSVLLELKHNHPANIITGFHSTTKNPNGEDRHKVMDKLQDHWVKESVGGINFVLRMKDFVKWVSPALEMAMEKKCNWDHQACKNSMAEGAGIVCAVPSVIQHIGFDSSMNHKGQPDIAADFFTLELPDVTLIGADGNHPEWLIHAANVSTSEIQFGDVVMLCPHAPAGFGLDPRIRPIHNLDSKEAYNLFCMKQFTKFVNTEFAIVFQGDGYIVNPSAWTDEFKQYDYIGATWWYKDGMNVGNGGFSFRSKKLLDILATDKNIIQYYPEDHHICRTYRKYLENRHGIKFAPAEVADRFSIEAAYTGPEGSVYNGQFGFHGWKIDYSKWIGLKHIPIKPRTGTKPPKQYGRHGIGYTVN